MNDRVIVNCTNFFESEPSIQEMTIKVGEVTAKFTRRTKSNHQLNNQDEQQLNDNTFSPDFNSTIDDNTSVEFDADFTIDDYKDALSETHGSIDVSINELHEFLVTIIKAFDDKYKDSSMPGQKFILSDTVRQRFLRKHQRMAEMLEKMKIITIENTGSYNERFVWMDDSFL